jgi:hypothetical protein
LITDAAHIGGSEGNQRLGPPGSRHELDFEMVRAEYFDDGAKVAALQSVAWKIPVQDDNVECVEGHSSAPGYAVTNRGAVSPIRMIHALITNDSPAGPFRIAQIS